MQTIVHPASPEAVQPSATREPLIRLEALSRGFREGERWRPVLCEVTMDFQRGEFIVLLGKSGSGKSTLLNLLSGIDKPDAGSIFVDGRDITRLSETERTRFRRRSIGFVFQFFNLVPTLTVFENVLLPLELNGMAAGEAKPRAQAMLDAVGLGDRGGGFPDRLSGGEQQRVAIARALVHDPLLLLADEPTGNLDSETSQQVLELLDRLTRRAGKTMIMVTHSQDMIGIADRVFRMREGLLEPF
jgi:putative ABC transport system ATP-binding protein